MVQRLTYRRRHGFRTTSNKVRKVKTPGGKLVFQYLTKKSNAPKCGDCGVDLQGIPATRPKMYRSLKKRERRVSRAYGGSRCAVCVRQRSAQQHHTHTTSSAQHSGAHATPITALRPAAPLPPLPSPSLRASSPHALRWPSLSAASLPIPRVLHRPALRCLLHSLNDPRPACMSQLPLLPIHSLFFSLSPLLLCGGRCGCVASCGRF